MPCTNQIVLVKAITVLNHAGLCVSYTSVWKYLKQLTAEARFLEIVREGHWLWVYDNLNLHQHVRHERQGKGHLCTCTILIIISTTYKIRPSLLHVECHFKAGYQDTLLARF